MASVGDNQEGAGNMTRDRLMSRIAFGFALLALSLLPVLTAKEAAAGPPLPWCAYLSGGWGVDCSYYTFEQCREFISGVGGYCSLNPYVAFVEEQPGYSKRKASKRPR